MKGCIGLEDGAEEAAGAATLVSTEEIEEVEVVIRDGVPTEVVATAALYDTTLVLSEFLNLASQAMFFRIFNFAD